MTVIQQSESVRGVSASPGIASGPAFVLERHRLRVVKAKLQETQVTEELRRLQRALEQSHQQVEDLRGEIEPHMEPNQILEAQALMLRDEALTDEPARLIREEKINAEWALARVLKRLRSLFEDADEEYLRDRRSDIDHVGDRVLRNLTGAPDLKLRAPAGAVVVAHDLTPADVVQFYRDGVVALALDHGGRTSHTVLMARAFELPGVVGLEDFSASVKNGDLVVVDGLVGEVVRAPTALQIAHYEVRATEYAASEEELLKDRDKPAVTQDGHRLVLKANIELAEEVALALKQGAEGIGLYRTEFLYMDRTSLPSEQEHELDARGILAGMGERPVTFRTFDLGGGEKTSPLIDWPEEDNPALGLRSIRLALREPAILRAQLRGLLRAAEAGQMRIMFPMVSGVQELRDARRELERCREEVARQGVTVPDSLEVGIMVEMPSAAMIADLLAQESDFLAIGSNDLIQYSLAIDRDNELVNYLYHPLHPAILRILRFVTRAAHDAGVGVSLCGEMAADPAYTLVMLGLGLDNLSMPAAAIPHVKRIVRASTYAESKTLVNELVGLPTVDAVEGRVREVMCPRFLDDISSLRARAGGGKSSSCEAPAGPVVDLDALHRREPPEVLEERDEDEPPAREPRRDS